MFGNKSLRKKIKELEAKIESQKYLIQQLSYALEKTSKPSEEKRTFCKICKHNRGKNGNFLCDKIPCVAFEPNETYQQ